MIARLSLMAALCASAPNCASVDAATPVDEPVPHAPEPAPPSGPSDDPTDPVDPVDPVDEAVKPAASGGDTAETGEPTEADPEDPAPKGAAPAAGEGKAPKRDAAPQPLPKPLYSKTDASCGKAPGLGRPAKSFRLPNPDGSKMVALGNYRNRVVLLNFWGTWCEPCLKELPEFDRLYRRYRKHGLTLVAVATDEDGGEVQAFIDERKLRAKVAIKGESLAQQYGDRTFPFTFVLDGKGVIQAAYDGYKPGCMGQLEADLREQLAALPRNK